MADAWSIDTSSMSRDSRPPSRASLMSEGRDTWSQDVPHRARDATRDVPSELRPLERGLRNRQLDAVGLFLKAHEKLLDDEPTPDSDPTLTRLTAMIELVLTVARHNVPQPQLRHFTQQLLHLTREYLQTVTKSVINGLREKQMSGSCPEVYQNVTELRLTRLTDHVEEVKVTLRALERNHAAQGSQGSRGSRGRGIQAPEERRMGTVLSDDQRRLVNLWDTLDMRALTVEGILAGELPLLQTYLLRRYGRQEADLTLIIEKGLEEGLAFIHDRDINSARNMFINMGFDADSKLSQICLYTSDRVLRDYLLGELRRTGRLSHTEEAMAGLVRALEARYSCPSYDVARVLRQEGVRRDPSSSPATDILPYPPGATPVTFDLTPHCGDLSPRDAANSETASYSHVLLEWVRHWDEGTTARVMLEHWLSTRDLSSSRPSDCPPAVVWDYLCCHLDTTRLHRWIDTQHPTNHDAKLPITWPYNQPITREMLDGLGKATNHVGESIADHLARSGVFLPSECSDLDLRLRRLVRIGAVFSPQCPLVSGGGMSVDLHYHVVQWCVREELAGLLYYYLDYWGLCHDAVTLSDVGYPTESMPSWVSMLLHFRRTANRLEDPSAVFSASLANSALTQRIVSASVAQMVDQGLLVRGLATLAYSPDHLHEFVSAASSDVVQSLGAHPHLQMALVGDRLQKTRSSPELTMYQLLKDNCCFDVTKLFGWQSANSLAADESPASLPHFSHEPLVARHGGTSRLSFMFYLRQGRPSAAFCAFLTDQSQAGALSWQQVHKVCIQAVLLSVRHHDDPVIPAATAAFVEMLGVDVTVSRLHVEVCVALSRWGVAMCDASQRADGRTRVQPRIAKLVERCLLQDCHSQRVVLKMLTDATYWEIDRHKLSRSSFEAGVHWHLPLLFCVYHGLPRTTAFLEDCARDGHWVMFMAYVQLHQYSTQQVSSLLSLFPSPAVREHLTCVISVVSDWERSSWQPDDDLETTLSPESENINKESTAPVPTGTPRYSGTPSPDVGVPDNPRDLYSLLRTVQQTPDTSGTLCTLAVTLRYPVLSVLAACVQPHCPLQCLASWFVASSSPQIHATYTQPADWSLVTLATLRDALIGHDLEGLLLRGLWIFQPDCLLVPYLRVHRSVSSSANIADTRQLMADFRRAYRQTRSVSSPTSPIPSAPPVLPVTWVERGVAALIQHFFSNCRNVANIEVMLQCLEELKMLKFFECDVLDVSKLHKIHNLTKDTNISLDYGTLGDKNHHNYGTACEALLRALHDGKYIREARSVAETLGIANDKITIQQLYDELSDLETSAIWDTVDTRLTFWSHCQDLLIKHRVGASEASQFFMSRVDRCQSLAEKSRVYKLAYDWLVLVDEDSPLAESKQEMFVAMWKNKIYEHLDSKTPPSDKPSARIRKEHLLTFDLRAATLPVAPPVDLRLEEARTLERLVGELLNRGEISEACKVVRHFGGKNTDLDIILTCLKLAKGILTPDRLNKELRKVLTGPQPLRLRRISTSTGTLARTLSMVSVGSLVSQLDVEEDGDEMSVLITIQNLCSRCVVAKTCAAFILTVYRITLMLQERFDWVLMCEDFTLIHRVLSSQADNRYMLTKSYIVTSALDDSQVAGFLCDAIVADLQTSLGLTTDPCSPPGPRRASLLQPCLDPARSTTSLTSVTSAVTPGRSGHTPGVEELLQMCGDPAVLGRRLLDTVTAMMSASAEMSRDMLLVDVELLVFANSCFTQSCHMEGISSVLRVARRLTDVMATAEEYVLMISLLTGLAHYSEMTYVFDILKHHHQFELLFRKGMDRDSRLRLAILDYLQRSHPDDIETYSMAALNFTMYREIAGMLEAEGRKELAKVTKIENRPEVQATLMKALRYFSDAAQSYVQDGCLRQAESCVRWARLVALQTTLLPANTALLHLHTDTVRDFVIKHNKFYEAFIVCEAYGCHTFWADALYHQVILAGSPAYLADLRNHVTITATLVSEVTDRYRLSPAPTKSMSSWLRRVLALCPDLRTMYTLAGRLSFNDVLREIRADAHNDAYLRDTGVIVGS